MVGGRSPGTAGEKVETVGGPETLKVKKQKTWEEGSFTREPGGLETVFPPKFLRFGGRANVSA